MRIESNLYEEYEFLAKKVEKLVAQWGNSKGDLTKHRIKKRARKFVSRMLDIREVLQKNGFPDPERFGSELSYNTASLSQYEQLRSLPHATNPVDGGLSNTMTQQLEKVLAEKQAILTDK